MVRAMASLYLVIAFLFGLTVMQVSPRDLTAIDMVAEIAGLAAFPVCALLLIKIVRTIRSSAINSRAKAPLARQRQLLLPTAGRL